MQNILVLFPNEWDLLEFSAPRYAGRYRFFYEGFDLHKFPENAKLMVFDARRFIERMLRKYRNKNIAGVLSNEEQFGTLIASVVAERLGVPGTSPNSILVAQHKYYARLRSREVVPEATPAFCVFPYAVKTETDVPMAFPMFAKPVKATYSILARRVENFRELKKLLSFHPLEKQILRQLVKPANDLAGIYADFAVNTQHIIGEEVLRGAQVTVDGFMQNGRVRILGIVDSIMYPGTNAFERFQYPSGLPQSVQARMADIVERYIRSLDFTIGLFNVELAYDSETDRISIIEINPRMAYQFADLYDKVDGFNPYDILLDLTLGNPASHRKGEGRYTSAASFVLRAFEGAKLLTAPSETHVESVRRLHHDARVMVYIKQGASLAREIKWLGSYRYAVLNIGAANHSDLVSRFHTMRSQLPFVFA